MPFGRYVFAGGKIRTLTPVRRECRTRRFIGKSRRDSVARRRLQVDTPCERASHTRPARGRSTARRSAAVAVEDVRVHRRRGTRVVFERYKLIRRVLRWYIAPTYLSRMISWQENKIAHGTEYIFYNMSVECASGAERKRKIIIIIKSWSIFYIRRAPILYYNTLYGMHVVQIALSEKKKKKSRAYTPDLLFWTIFF